MQDAHEPYRSKAIEALAGARSELAAGRFNNAANRAYYAACQAAIVGLLRAGYMSRNNAWDHSEVQAAFAGQLFGRRKLYPSSLKRSLADLSQVRGVADYGEQSVSQRPARNAVKSAQSFVIAILGEIDDPDQS